MTTDPVAATAAATAAATQGGTTATGLPSNESIDKQQFLILFVEQLKNQDPLSPLEPNDLTAQLAQFSSLEQLTSINDKLDSLSNAYSQTTDGAVLGLIGRAVSFDGSQIGVQDGKAPRIQYTLDGAAEGVNAVIRNQSGQIVRVVDLGKQAAGSHTFDFDGRADSGAVLADGTYRVEITAKAANASTGTTVPLVASGVVDGVDLSSSPPTLIVGGRKLTLSDVKLVSLADAAS
jgi:flagellar basal-body rod modification protein FlgD